MPKRTNEFQQLVKYLYDQLAPIGARITESGMVYDSGGEIDREVDVLIEHVVDGRPMSMAIECRDYKRAQTIEWIDYLHGRYAKMAVDKIIAVSKTPFTKPAKTKARNLGIELITVNEA